MIRTKDMSATRNATQKTGSFTFRRIQARELYQPAHEVDGANSRVLFRLRVNVSNRQSP